jgi:hypothetical protein
MTSSQARIEPLYGASPRLVTALPLGGSRPLYGGVHEVRGYWETYFFLSMVDNIIYRLVHLTLSHSDM